MLDSALAADRARPLIFHVLMANDRLASHDEAAGWEARECLQKRKPSSSEGFAAATAALGVGVGECEL